MKRTSNIVLTLSLVPCAWCVVSILQTPTMILPSWFILCILALPAVTAAFGIGFVLKQLFGSGWHTATFASMLLAAASLVYLITTYRPTYTVVIDPGYAGEVRLFVSRYANNREIRVNRYGIGYIGKKTFDNGFYPRILKGGRDISKEVSEYSTGAIATSAPEKYRFEYLAFEIPGTAGSPGDDPDSLVKTGAIDTTYLLCK
jgi:hypothetical protein